jgi:hypothetical protein
MSSTGTSLPKRRRPRDEIGFVHIKLKKDVQEMWITRKDSIAFSTKTHSDFAQHLLLNFCEDEPLQSPGDGKYYIFVINVINFFIF